MTIFRTHHSKNYTVINNTINSDARLSFKAKGIWLYAFSRPDDWTFYLNDIINQSTDGKKSVMSGIKELEKYGYLIKKKEHGKDGKIYYSWTFFEIPQIKISSPECQKGSTVKGSTEKEPLLSTDITNQNTSYSLLNEEKEVSKDTSPRSRKSAPRSRIPDIVFSKDERKFQGVTEQDMQQWGIAYPEIDLDKEIAKMIIWLESNPRKANKRNWRRYIANWLSRASDSALSREMRSEASKMSSKTNVDRRTKNIDGTPMDAPHLKELF